MAAGLGTRMNKFYPDIPKPLMPIKEKPLIQHQIEHLKKFGIKDFYINLHYLPNKIKSHLGDGTSLDVNIIYSFEKNILGTSGALNNFKKELDETFVVLYGDIFTKLDFNKFLKFHKARKSAASLFIHKTDHPEDSDLVDLGSKNRINKIYISPHKKPIPHTNFSSAAIYILEPNVLQFLQKGSSDFMEDFFPLLNREGIPLYGYFSKEFSKDIGTPTRYAEVLEKIAKLNL